MKPDFTTRRGSTISRDYMLANPPPLAPDPNGDEWTHEPPPSAWSKASQANDRFTADFRQFLKLICSRTKLTPQEVVRGHSIAKGHTRARQLLVWLMIKRGHSKTEIANAFGYAHSGVDALARQFEQVRHVYAAIIKEAIPSDQPTGNPVIDAVAKATGVPALAICSHTRTVAVASARHMALVLFSELNPQADDTACAQFVKRRHLTTTKEARAKVTKLYESDESFRDAMDYARELLSINQ